MDKKNKTKKKLSPQVLIPMIVGIVCVCVILVVMTVIMPRKATASELQEKLDLGTKYLTAGEYEKAEVAFNDALKIDKKSTDATMGLARTYNGMQQPDKALDMLKKAGKNIENISNSSLKKNSDAWSQRISDYQNIFTDTKTLFKEQGNTSKIEDVEKEERKIIDIIIKVVHVTPTVTTPPEDFSNGDDSGNNSGSEKEPDDPTPPEDQEQPGDPTPPEDQEQPDDPTPPEDQEQPGDPTPPEDQEQPGDPTPSEDQEQPDDPTPPEDQEQPEPTTPTDDSSPVEEIPLEGEEPVEEPDTSENTEPDSMTDEEILSAYTAQLEASSAKYTGGTIAYTDNSSMSAVNGFLATEQRDFDGDQIPELLSVSVSDGALQFELYKVDNGEVVQTASETLDPGFGTPVDGITYSGSQECFIKDNGTSVDIGFASYYSGMSGDSGNPEARTEIVLYKVGNNGEVSLAGDISLVNGAQVYLNGDTPQDGGKETFISELSQIGLSGTWITESADVLTGMDLINNPMQDTAGAPNPINAGLSAKESGVQDLAIVNAGMQPGTSNMDFSVK